MRIPRFTIREVLFGTTAFAALAALFVGSASNKYRDETGTSEISTILIAKAFENSPVNARIWNASLSDGEWGEISIVSPEDDNVLAILHTLTDAISNVATQRRLLPIVIFEPNESCKCVAVQWKTRYHVAGYAIVHLKTTQTNLVADDVKDAGFKHDFAILVYDQ